jgi:hypothetical protein
VVAALSVPQRASRPSAALPVVLPGEAELAVHEQLLQRVAKASGGRVLFKST